MTTITKATKDIALAVSGGAVPGVTHQIFSALRISEDSLSLFRNILCAIPVIGPKHTTVNHLSYYVGLVSAFFSCQALVKNVADYKQSSLIHDSEGKTRCQISILASGTGAIGSIAYLVGRVFDTFAFKGAATVLAGSADTFLGVGSVVALAASSWGALRCLSFRHKLTQLTHDPKAALLFLKESITAAPGENEEAKVKYLKRRTSCKSVRLIATQVDEHLAKLEKGEGVAQAKALIQTVLLENKAKTLLYLITLLAGLIALAGLVLSTFFTLGALPFILYGIAGSIYLGTTIYNTVQMYSKIKS